MTGCSGTLAEDFWDFYSGTRCSRLLLHPMALPPDEDTDAGVYHPWRLMLLPQALETKRCTGYYSIARREA